MLDGLSRLIAIWRLPSGPQTFGLLFKHFWAPLLGSGAVLGSVFRTLGLHFERPEAPFLEPWGPLVLLGAILGVSWRLVGDLGRDL